MRKFFVLAAGVILGLICFLGMGDLPVSETSVSAVSKVQVHFFWGDGCPYCEKEKVFWQEYMDSNPGVIDLHSYEVYNNAENLALMKKVGDSLGIETGGVPLVVIGDEPVLGFSEEITVPQIEELIAQCLSNTCDDAVLGVKDSSDPSGSIAEAPSTDDTAADEPDTAQDESAESGGEEDQQNDENSDGEYDYVESDEVSAVSIIFGVAAVFTFLVVGGALIFLLGNSNSANKEKKRSKSE